MRMRKEPGSSPEDISLLRKAVFKNEKKSYRDEEDALQDGQEEACDADQYQKDAGQFEEHFPRRNLFILLMASLRLSRLEA